MTDGRFCRRSCRSFLCTKRPVFLPVVCVVAQLARVSLSIAIYHVPSSSWSLLRFFFPNVIFLLSHVISSNQLPVVFSVTSHISPPHRFSSFSVYIVSFHRLWIFVPSFITRHFLKNVVFHEFSSNSSVFFPFHFLPRLFSSSHCSSFPGGVFFLLFSPRP